MNEVELQSILSANPAPSNTAPRGAATPATNGEEVVIGDADTPQTESRDEHRPIGWFRRSRVLAHETIETIITALTLAFIFRAFLIEAFIIPTGSMAQSLLGEHRTYICTACGYQYDVGAMSPSRDDAGDLVALDGPPTCPNCHRPADGAAPAQKSGDRILVHKWPFELGGWFGPKRWDVIVFRDPADPRVNYIKRLIALPGDTIEIADGDIFIDGRISRKTAAAQRSLWFLVHDQNFTPTPDDPTAERSPWRTATAATGATGWSGLDTRVVRFAAPDEQPHNLEFDAGGIGPYHQDFYAYNGGPSGMYVGDLRVSADILFSGGPDGDVSIEIERHGRRFIAKLAQNGTAQLSLTQGTGAGPADAPQIVGVTANRGLSEQRMVHIEFAHVDWQALLRVDNAELATTDAQYADDISAARAAVDWPAQLRIVARATDLEIRNLRVDRDVFYTGTEGRARRAYAGHPFALHEDEYFVMGDNSPHSHDSREWSTVGPHLRNDYYEDRYRMGTVREDQIVGRAFFVYLPGLLPPDERGWRLVDLGRVRFIR